ncbi:glutathione S-transferase [Mycena albidolilacea]|uniref:glutathione transferase n=1 Tax=Mycena albidolilacea TaxID=1033008 RepID=A0AAD6Z2C2_9AGAR|nr:glutathione S-transferase [Mycena albidolilacea]
MVLKLYTDQDVGGGSAIVGLTLVEKHVPYEYVPVNMDAKEHKTPEYMAKHPFGQVPMIDDDGFVVYESRAICRYILEKYPNQGPELLPKGLKERTLVEQAAAVEYATFTPALLPVLNEVRPKRLRGAPVDQAVLNEALKELSAKLDVYEVILGKQKFLAGDEFSFADLCHYAYAPLLITIGGIDIMTSKGPNITRWWNELISRPTWVKLNEEGFKSTVS